MMKEGIIKKMLAVCSATLMPLGMRKFKVNRSNTAYLLVVSLVMSSLLINNPLVVFAADPEILINYSFDDENANDSSGKGNNGIIKGNVSYTNHNDGKALVLNGSGWIELPSSLVYNNQQFTVEISFNTTSTQVGIFGYQNTSVNGLSDAYVPIISIDKNGKLYTEMFTTTQMVVSSSADVNDGQWHRVIMTSDNSSIKVYLDGQFLGSQSGSVNHFNMTYNQIGTNAAWSRETYFDLSTYQWTPYTGMLDDFIFYPIAKDADEIAKTTQTISFAEIDNKTTSDSTFDLNATASSGLTITYSSSNTDVATISGNTVTIQGAGTTVITANQPGNDTYSAAPQVTRTLTVEEASPTAAELANESIATAKGLLPTSFTANEGTDTNLLTYLNSIEGMSDTGVTLTLDSSNSNVADDGTITYDSSTVTDDVVVHINKADGTEETRTIIVTVPAHTMTDAEAVAGAKTDLDSSDLIFGGSDTASAVTQDFTLPASGSNGTSISWTEKTDTGNNINLSGNSAIITRPAYGEGDKTVTLTASITKNGVTETKDIEVNIKVYAPSNVSSRSSDDDASINISNTQTGTVNVVVNGKEEKAGIETRATEDGKSTVTFEVDSKVIEGKIDEGINNNSTGVGNLIQVPVADTESDVVEVKLTGDIVKKLEDNNFDVSVTRDNIEYIIPAEEFTIIKVAENLGVSEEALVDIKVEVQITKLDQNVVDKYNEVAKAKGDELILPPIAFEVAAKTTKQDGTTGEVKISKFSNYVERVMEIPTGVDPNKITTGIVFNPDGSYSHVPTEVFQKDGKWYAKINSLTNSNYSVVWNPVTVNSVENHWSKDAVNDMASRLVIFNVESFEPNKAITRADFAEYIVRALGLYRKGETHGNNFSDVSTTGDRTLAILIASEYGIVEGYPDGTFRPDALITREEAMTMYQRAMKITKLTGSDANRISTYSDREQVSKWAVLYVTDVLSANVFNGTTSTTISPKSNFTYGEAAQAIKNLLVESKLINK